MTEHENFDNRIGRALRDVDPVPETPREEMWTAISAARREERGAPAVIPITPHAAQAASRRHNHAWLRIGAPLAATLILGVGLGRMTMHDRQAGNGTAVANATSGDSAHAAAPSDTAGRAPDTITSRDAERLAQLQAPAVVAVKPQPQTGLARSVKRNDSRMANTRSTVVRDAAPAATSSNANLAYRVAANRHFERVQTLLVSLPGDARDGHVSNLAVRAADLLVNTRLLLDSPVARDQETHRLLDDLELILAQVATISPTHTAEDVDIIQNAITRRDVLLRLRAATAGLRSSAT